MGWIAPHSHLDPRLSLFDTILPFDVVGPVVRYFGRDELGADHILKAVLSPIRRSAASIPFSETIVDPDQIPKPIGQYIISV